MTPARAETHRYALVVGNNEGVHPAVGAMPPLRHAERDARAIGERLVGYGRFDPERVRVVTGGDRAAVRAAAQALAARRAADRAAFGEHPALFVFFFTGHGAEGGLLTPGAPLDGDDIAAVFAEMDAALSVAVFDACHSGSLAVEALRAKGAEPMGFNPVAAVPQAALAARGTVWLMSSRPDEISYEHERLGGLFTHYFLDAFTAAPADRFGVSLDAMWEHARRQTALHARRLRRAQTPQRVARRLTETGPVYLSFPRARTARLVLGAAVEGEFFLSYPDETLVERVAKRKGAPLEVAVLAGPLVVSAVAADGTARPLWSTRVAEAARLWMDAGEGGAGAAPPGFERAGVEAKGASAWSLRSVEPADGWWLATSARAAPLDGVAASAWGGEMGVVWVDGMATAGAAVGVSGRGDVLPAWSSRLMAVTGRVEGGVGYAGRWLRVDALAQAGAEVGWQRFGDGWTQARSTGSGGLAGRLWVPLGRWAVVGDAALRGGRADGLGAGSGARWFLGPELRLGVAARFD
ncbi:MAG: caspase family protein [Myxococcales bacterium]|nr:caspase family protein [Myxococcales bacterium]